MAEAARAAGPQEMLQIAAAATLYYRAGRTKIEIADELGISRFRVARMLELAVKLGIVRFEITVPDGIDADLSRELAAAYGLRRAIVVDIPDKPVLAMRTQLGRVTANLLREIVEEGDVVGVSWGRSVNAMTSALTEVKRCSIVQLTGALDGAEVNDNPIDLVRRMSEISRGDAYPIYAPLVVDDPGVAASLRGKPQVAAALEHYEKVTIAVIPVGSWVPPSSGLYSSLAPDERDRLIEAGVRVDTSTVLLAEDGSVVTTTLNDRMIGITGEQLHNIPEVVAVAGGAVKAEAVRIALRAGFVTTLVTNATVARELLAEVERPADRG